MQLLSTQFLSFVLGLNEAKYDHGLLFYRNEFDSNVYRELNVYELAHLCKEWAYKQSIFRNNNIVQFTLIDLDIVVRKCVTGKYVASIEPSNIGKEQSLITYGGFTAEELIPIGNRLQDFSSKRLSWSMPSEPEAIFMACQFIFDAKSSLKD